MSEMNGSNVNYVDVGYVAFATLMVFFMTPALGFFYGGMVRRKNVLNTIMMSMAAIGIIGLQWTLYGYSLSFSGDFGGIIGDFGWAGLQGVGLKPNPDLCAGLPHLEFAVFQMMFAVITAAIISGSIAERVNFYAYCLVILLWTTLVYDPLCHMVWNSNGIIYQLGAMDFAGGTVIHISSGVSGLVAALYLGTRRNYGRMNVAPHNVPYIILGGSIIWAGWFAFNSGCALGANEIMVLALANTAVSSMAGMVTWMLLDKMVHGNMTLFGSLTGGVAGLVGVTPAAGFIEVWASTFIGIITAIACFVAISYVKEHFGYDDSLDAFGCHGVGGICGAMLTGVFSTKLVNPEGFDGLLYGNPGQLIPQGVSVLVAIMMAVVMMPLILKLVSFVVPLRVSEETEKAGLDLIQHHETAYSKM
ncbi:MAG: ammonium transporter [Selenomonadaceae bacterium]|nr:ammonium transporter [Selenomonadaceae bacterium]